VDTRLYLHEHPGVAFPVADLGGGRLDGGRDHGDPGRPTVRARETRPVWGRSHGAGRAARPPRTHDV